MANVRNIVAAIGGKNENEKTTWVKLGVLIETNDGKLRLKIDAIPTSKDWDGWASVFDDSDRQQAQPQGQARNSGGRQYPPKSPPISNTYGPDPDDQIPF